MSGSATPPHGRSANLRIALTDRIGELWGYPESSAFAELLIDCEEDAEVGARRDAAGDRTRGHLELEHPGEGRSPPV
jgi:hypothetical protein